MADKKQIHTQKDDDEKQCSVPEDHPLDPAVEKIRKKLMRLMIISVSITLILILAVLFGIIYKMTATEFTSKKANTSFSHSKNSEIIQRTLSLPKGTQILSQNLSENNIALKVLTPEGQIKFMIYNYHTGALVAILLLETKEERL
ncbi:hypothetical protein V3565_04505 [Bartonella sp. B10]